MSKYDGHYDAGYEAYIDGIHRDIADLQAENDKLRELVRDMYAAFVHGNCYRWCEFKEPCNYIDDGKCQWFDRMVELGTEVVE